MFKQHPLEDAGIWYHFMFSYFHWIFQQKLEKISKSTNWLFWIFWSHVAAFSHVDFSPPFQLQTKTTQQKHGGKIHTSTHH